MLNENGVTGQVAMDNGWFTAVQVAGRDDDKTQVKVFRRHAVLR